MDGDNAPAQQGTAGGGEADMVVNLEVVTIAYLSQQNIGSLLGQGDTMVGVWRHRFKNTPDPFPEPNSMTGIGKRGVPGWLPERMTEIRAWLERHPGLAAGDSAGYAKAIGKAQARDAEYQRAKDRQHGGGEEQQ